MAKISEARKRANKKWNDSHKSKQRLYLYRSHAKKFVREIASEDDLKELQKMIADRLNDLQ